MILVCTFSVYRPIEKLVLIPVIGDGENVNFTATFGDNNSYPYYWILVTPEPLHGGYPKLTSGNFSLSFRNNTRYNVTVNSCPFPNIASHFTIGKVEYFMVVGS